MRQLAYLTLLAPIVFAGCGGGGGSTPAPVNTGQPAPSGAGQCSPQALPVGTTIALTLGSSNDPAFVQTVSATSNGMTLFHGNSALEVELQSTDNESGTSTDSKAYATIDPATSLVTNFGQLTDANGSSPTHTFNVTTDGVYTPPFVDSRYTLTAGQSTTQSWTQAQAISSTVDGVTQSSTATVTVTMTTTFVGLETITVPAGTYNTCKFVESTTNGQSTSQDTHWLLVGYGVDVMAVQGGVTLSAKTVSVNGAPL